MKTISLRDAENAENRNAKWCLGNIYHLLPFTFHLSPFTFHVCPLTASFHQILIRCQQLIICMLITSLLCFQHSFFIPLYSLVFFTNSLKQFGEVIITAHIVFITFQ